MVLTKAARFALLGVVVLALPVLAGCLGFSSTSSYYLRETGSDANAFKGYLTWNGGKGGIAWDKSAPTEAKGGVSDMTQGLKTTIAWNTRTNMLGTPVPVPMDSFESQPLPKTIYLNVSDPIKIDIFTQSSNQDVDNKACSNIHQLEYQLWLGEVFVAGAVNGFLMGYWYDRDGNYHGPPPSVTPDGRWCVKSARLHPEVDRLPAGSKVTLNILHHGQTTDLQFGMAGEYRSTIRFQMYTAEEAIERVPELVEAQKAKAAASESSPRDGTHFAAPEPAQPSAVDDEGDDSGGISIGVLGLGLAGVALGLRPLGRRRMVATLVILGFLSMGLAGCLGLDGGASGEGDSADNVSVDIEHDANVSIAKGFGAILGLVKDRDGYPISGAHVALLGTTNATISDAKGKFAFLDIQPFTYGLRVDAKTFISVESKVKVVAGNVSKVTITMYPLYERGPGFRPHPHDEWGLEKELPLWSGRVNFKTYLTSTDAGSCMNWETIANTVCWQAFYPTKVEGLDKDPMILPGTGQIDVKITWDPGQNNVDRVGVAFMGNHDRYYYNYTFMYPRGNGATTRIMTNWEMTDIGHQRFSTWEWYLYIPTNGGPYANPVVSGGQTVRGPFQVDMTIHKAVVPIEPEHQDFWGNQTTLKVIDKYSTTIGCTGCTTYYLYPWDYRLVPPETKELVAWLNLSAPTTPDLDWVFSYMPANVPPVRQSDPGAWKVATLLKDESTPTSKKFKIIPLPEETDAFYQSWSYWQYDIQDGHDEPILATSNAAQFTMMAFKGDSFV
jgi:hypothetical protein